MHTDKLFPSGYRGCCCTGDTGSVSFESPLGECNALDGYFKYIPDFINCNAHQCITKGKTGCCCACSFGGMTSGVEECTCEDLGGVWVEGDCSNQSEDLLCKITDPVNALEFDYRKKTACCGVTLIGGVTQAYCELVCTPAECEDNTLPGFRSNYFYGVNTCSAAQIQCSLPSQFAAANYNGNATLEDYVYGNCCIQKAACQCLQDVTLSQCLNVNGSFYILGEVEYDCSMCYKNCSRATT